MTDKDFIDLWYNKIANGSYLDIQEEVFETTENVTANGKVLSFGGQFFDNYEIIDSVGNSVFTTPQITIAKYVIYKSQSKVQVIQVPTEESVCLNFVKEYEQKVNSLFKKIIEDYKKNSDDEPKSFEITNSILRRLDITRY